MRGMGHTGDQGHPVRQTDEYGNPIHHTGGTMGDYTGMHDTTGRGTGGGTGYGTTGTHTTPMSGTHTTGAGYGEGLGQGQQHHGGGLTSKLHRSGSSSSSSSSEDDGMGGRRKKGLKEKIKEKLPGGGHKVDEQRTSATTPGAYGYEGEHVHGTGQVHEKKGMMEKIKEKLPGQH